MVAESAKCFRKSASRQPRFELRRTNIKLSQVLYVVRLSEVLQEGAKEIMNCLSMGVFKTSLLIFYNVNSHSPYHHDKINTRG